MDRVQLTRLLLIVSVLYVIGFYFAGAAIKPAYSQLSNFVSEYNATGTPWAETLTYSGFVATTVLLAGFLVAAAPIIQISGASRVGFWLLWSLPFSYLIGAIAPCDAGCPVEGSTSQLLHNALAIPAYFGMGAGVALLSLAPGLASYKLRRSFMLLTGIAFPVVFVAMVQPDFSPWRGLLQRSLDVAMAISLVIASWTLIPSSQHVSNRVS
ncbi:MAG: DUF998 domain-containing protein [Pseudomonadota bacterium]